MKTKKKERKKERKKKILVSSPAPTSPACFTAPDMTLTRRNQMLRD